MTAPQTAPEAAPAASGPAATEARREWIFTFGGGHRLYSVYPGEAPEGEGVPLTYRFVRIEGTRDSARAEIYRLFGRAWAFQYASEDAAGVEEYGLKELVI